jgi:hypothetical protein
VPRGPAAARAHAPPSATQPDRQLGAILHCHYGSDGERSIQSMVSTYLSYRLYTQDLSKTLKRVASEAQTTRDSEYFQENIGKVTTVDEFLGNYRLYSFAMKAYGLKDMIYAKAFMRKVLESDLTKSDSFAEKLNDKRFATFAAAFNFGTDGKLKTDSVVQSSDQEDGTVGLYTQKNAEAVADTSVETAYYQAHIGAITSVDDLLANTRLYQYALTAAGLDPDRVSKTAVRNALTSDLADPGSAANTLGGGFLVLAQSFNFDTDGSIKASFDVQSATQKTTMIGRYAVRDDAGLSGSLVKLHTSYYENHIETVKSVDALLNDSVLYDYVLTAYGIDSADVSKTTIRQVLESDVSDSGSFVNRLGDTRLQKLASAFNFDSKGGVASRRLVQSVENAANTISLYNKTVDNTSYAQHFAEKETTYYEQTISTIKSLDEFLADKRLVAYVLRAHGLEDENVSKDDLRKILTSDITDKKSYVNRLSDTRYHDLAAAFNFDTDGTIERGAAGAQSKKAAGTTTDLFVRQTMEGEAGDKNEGVRLALYFERKASGISSAYDILADKALLEVVQTAYGLSKYMSSVDIDVQAAILKKRIDFTDFKDAKKLEKFISRFCAMYDIQNSDAGSADSAVSLFRDTSADGVVGFDETLIASMQNLKIGN